MSSSALEIELLIETGVDPGVTEESLVDAARTTLGRLGVCGGHAAIEIVGASRITQLNREYRGKDGPTDVLSFPVDGEQIAAHGPPTELDAAFELGDVIVCPPHTSDMHEAIVHGVLHLCGYDHEVDEGQMLRLQDEIVSSLRR